MDYLKKIRVTPRCLHCGDLIEYGRSDKKFCSDDCRTSHHYSLSRGSNAFKRRILSQLNSNYEILDSLCTQGTDSIDLSDLILSGFVPEIFTSFHHSRSHRDYLCFDIKYRLSDTRVFSISKIQNVSLHLQDGKKAKIK